MQADAARSGSRRNLTGACESRAPQDTIEQDCKFHEPQKLDWRQTRHARRTALAKECAIMNCEHIVKGDALELGT
eukprot:5529416-Pyramimonas_sp.AAC.1